MAAKAALIYQYATSIYSHATLFAQFCAITGKSLWRELEAIKQPEAIKTQSDKYKIELKNLLPPTGHPAQIRRPARLCSVKLWKRADKDGSVITVSSSSTFLLQIWK